MKDSADPGIGGNCWWEAARTVDNLCVVNRSDVPLIAYSYKIIQTTSDINSLRPVAGFIRSPINNDNRVQTSNLDK
jgi:hypothetical protein